MPEIEPYDGARPSFFPLRIDPNKNNLWDLGSDFGEHLAELLQEEAAAENNAVEESETATQSKNTVTSAYLSNSKLAKTAANTKATRLLSFFQKMLDFLPRNRLAYYEFTGDKYNSEQVKDDGYFDYRGKLNQAFWDPSKQFVKPGSQTGAENAASQFGFDEKGRPVGKMEKRTSGISQYTQNDIYGNLDESFIQKNFQGAIAGEGNTWSHNFNLYHGAASWNPYKTQAEDSNVFETNDVFSGLNNSFNSTLSGLSDLDPSLWDKINGIVSNIQNTESKEGEAGNVFSNPNEVNDDHDLNWEDAPEFYSDTKEIKSFDINANYYTILMSEMWKNWSDTQHFGFLLQMYEAKKRGTKAFRDILGRVADLPNPYASNMDAQYDRVKAVVDRVEAFSEDVASNLQNSSMMLPFALMPEAAHATFLMTDALGDWGQETGVMAPVTQDGLFRQQAISGYLTYINENYLQKQFLGDGFITKEYLELQTGLSADAVISELERSGYITSEGQITSKFVPNDPNFELSLPFSDSINQQIYQELIKVKYGALDINALDETLVGGVNRYNIQLKDAYGNTQSLGNLLANIGMGGSSEEVYSNARDTYNVLFDVYASMTGLDLESDGVNGNVKGEETSSGTFKTDVYPKGSWNEYNSGDDETVAGWVTVKDQPVEIEFKSRAEAQAYADKIKQAISLLEPVVAGFDPISQSGPGHYAMVYHNGQAVASNTRILVDNSGSIDAVSAIKSGDSMYRIQMDFVSHSGVGKTKYQQSDDMTAVRGYGQYMDIGGQSWADQFWKFTGEKALLEKGREIFETKVSNAAAEEKHSRDVEEYDEKEEEYYEDEVQKLVDYYKQLKKEQDEKKADKELQIKLEREKQAQIAKKRQEDRRKA